MAIQNDFRIYPKTKTIRHVSGTTVYSAIAFYSYLMTAFDEPGYLTYETPIRFNTPQSFTMLNRWFLDNGDGSNILQYLTGGGIDTTGYSTVTFDDPVYMLDMDATTDFTSADLDAEITDDGVAVGPLLAYKNDYPSANLARIWVRDTRATPATIADNSVIATTGAGPGAGTAFGASVSGDEIYHNLFTIASFPGSPDPQVYIYQNHPQSGARVRIAEWSAFTNWDRGSIDVLIPVQLGGTLINLGKISTFVRQTGDTYTFVESTLDTSGRTPIATETSSDTVNITKGEHYMFYTSVSNPSYTVGTVIQDVATGGASPPTWYAEIVAHTNWSATSGYITIRGLRGVPADTNAIYVGATQLGTATVNGSVGDTIVSYDTETTAPVAGDLGKPVDGSLSTAERILRAFKDDGTSGKLLLQVYHTHGAIDGRTYTGTTRDFLYKQFVDNDVITSAPGGSALLNVTLDVTITPTTIISGYSDVTVAHMNGTISVGTFAGTFTPGERITWTGGEAIMIETNGSSTMSLGNVTAETNLNVATTVLTGNISGATCQIVGTVGLTDDNTEDFAFPLQSANNYSVFIEGGTIYNAGRSLSDIYGYLQYYLRDGQAVSSRTIYTSDGSSITALAAEEYIKAVSTYSATKVAPFGTLAGSTFFGAQGVWITGMQTSDNNNIKLTDHGGTLREPFTSVNLTISNTRVGDRIAVYLEDGTTTLPKKNQYTSHATTNLQSDSVFDAPDTVTFPNDTPTSGTFIVVDTSASEEHRYRYASFNNTSGTGSNDGQLVLPTEIAGDAAAGSDGQTLVSTSVFGSSQIGDIIRRTNNEGGWAYITEVTSATTVQTTLFNAGITAGWDETATADHFESLSLVVTYDGTDTFFIPYMDFRETAGTDGTPGSEIVTVTYVSDREVIIEARNVESSTQIVPFKTTGTITSTGLSQSVIRTEDTVYT